MRHRLLHRCAARRRRHGLHVILSLVALHATVAATVSIAQDRATNGGHAQAVIEVEGIVRSVTPEGVVFRLATPTGITSLVAPWAAGQEQMLVDSQIRARGTWMTITRADGSTTRALLVEDRAQLDVLEPPPGAASGVPLLALPDLFQIGDTSARAHRIRVTGTVTAHSAGRSLYLTDGVRHLQVRSSQRDQLAPGDVVEVLGFVAAGGPSPSLADAVFRRVGSSAPPAPERLDAARLLDRSRHHVLVSVTARLVRHGVDINDYELVLTADGIVFEASLPITENGANLEELIDGSLLEVTGIANIRSRGNRTSLSADIQLRSADDVRVLASPPWWTPRRVGFLFVMVFVALVGTGGWVVALRRRLPVAERARVESEERYRRLFEQAPAGHFVSRADGTLIACNEAFARMLGFASAAEAVGSDCEALYADPADRQHWLELLRSGRPVDNRDVTLRGKDDRIVPALETAVARCDERGELSEIQGFLIDRTEQKRAEAMLRERDAQLLQSQKMEAIGRLAGGVAHDFNNLLTVIVGNSELARDVCADHLDAVEYIDEVQKAAKSATGLTRQLLAFSRRHQFEPTNVDLNAVVAELDKMLQRLLGEDIELIVTLAAERISVEADRAQLDQVVVNLAVNARDAMPYGGRLSIETRVQGPTALLVVSDTGCGMDDEVLAQIFEPFFTTKQPGQGTGLGLAMVYGAITHSGGTIHVQSQRLQGATFTITLPRVDDEAKEPLFGGSEPATSASETILLVEDEAGVRSLAQRILEGAGYTVLVTREAREAISAAQRHVGSIDLLLTDVVMPGMSGPELAESLSTIRPDTRVLLMSGYTDHAMVNGYSLASTALLWKPFTSVMLLNAVRRTLTLDLPVSGAS